MNEFNEEDSQNDSGPSSAQITQNHLKFFLAGKAFFTLRSMKTGARFTYRITRATDKEDPSRLRDQWFVSFLTGPDNWQNYTYIGSVYPKDGAYVFYTTRASKLPAEAPPCVAIRYAFDCLSSSPVIKGVEVWHSGKCGRCGRMLTVPESIASGFGPECAGLV